MAHKLVEHLLFTREKWLTGYDGLSAEDAAKRHGDANCPSWMVGHLACFEQFTWCQLAQGITVVDTLDAYNFGQPATTPNLPDVLADWHKVMDASLPYLEALTDDDMTTYLKFPDGKNFWDDIGTTILRHTWHYWYHLGEMQALRSGMGHKDMTPYIGNMRSLGPWK